MVVSMDGFGLIDIAALLVPAGAAAQMALLPPPPESAMTKPAQ